MKKLDPTKIILNGLGGHGTAEKLTVQTHGIESCRERLKIEGETEASAYAARRVFLRSLCSFDNKVSRKTKGRKTKYYEGKEKKGTLNSI